MHSLFIPTLQMGPLRLKDLKWLDQGHVTIVTFFFFFFFLLIILIPVLKFLGKRGEAD